MVFPSLAGSLAHMQSGKLLGLGVTGPKRSASAPQLPTIAEAGLPGYELTPWHALLAPAGTPKPTITKLHADVVKALAAPEIKSKLIAQGIDNIVCSTPDELAAFIKGETAKYEKLAAESPTVLAEITLDEGGSLLARVITSAPESLTTGMEVELIPLPEAARFPLPTFRPVAL